MKHPRRFRAALLMVAAATTAFSTVSAQNKSYPWDPDEKWGADIAKFEAQDAEKQPEKNPILFVGSSSIRMWDLPNSWPEANMLNRGFGGSTIGDTTHFFDRIVAPYEPKAIVLYAGDNDVANKLTVEEVVEDFQELAALVEEKLPGTPLIYVAIKPSIRRWDMWPTMDEVNDRIAAICEESGNLYFADIATRMMDRDDAPPTESMFKADGLHMTEEGYAAWVEVIDPILIEAGAK